MFRYTLAKDAMIDELKWMSWMDNVNPEESDEEEDKKLKVKIEKEREKKKLLAAKKA